MTHWLFSHSFLNMERVWYRVDGMAEVESGGSRWAGKWDWMGRNRIDSHGLNLLRVPMFSYSLCIKRSSNCYLWRAQNLLGTMSNALHGHLI